MADPEEGINGDIATDSPLEDRCDSQPDTAFGGPAECAATGSELTEGGPSHWATFALVGIILMFIALGTLIAFKTPAYESADEPGHVQNIETLVAGH